MIISTILVVIKIAIIGIIIVLLKIGVYDYYKEKQDKLHEQMFKNKYPQIYNLLDQICAPEFCGELLRLRDELVTLNDTITKYQVLKDLIPINSEIHSDLCSLLQPLKEQFHTDLYNYEMEFQNKEQFFKSNLYLFERIKEDAPDSYNFYMEWIKEFRERKKYFGLKS